MINQYPQYPSGVEYTQHKSRILYVLIGIVVLTVVFFLFKSRFIKPPEISITTTTTVITTIKTVCGNGVCESGENEYNCCLDCPCSEAGEACNYENNVCMKKMNTNICGDGICDWGEDIWNCCLDCRYCPEGMKCDPETTTCIYIEINVTDAEAISLFKEFIIDQGIDPQEVEKKEYEVRPNVYEDKPSKYVCTKPEEETMIGVICGYVLENRTVIGPVEYW